MSDALCLVPRCDADAILRGVCRKHYQRWQKGNLVGYDGKPIEIIDSRDAEHLTCTCPDARHDDWECPMCRRPSFSQGRIDKLRGMVWSTRTTTTA